MAEPSVPGSPAAAPQPAAVGPLVESPLRIMWRRLIRRAPSVAGGVILLLIVLISVLAPRLTVFDPGKPDLTYKFAKPLSKTKDGKVMLFGGDSIGRDVFTRTLYGGRISLKVGFLAAGVSLLLGIVLGAVSGYYGGWIDNAVMRVVDIFLSLPSLLLLITVVAVFGPAVPKGGEIWLLMGTLGLLGWPNSARIVRGEFLSLRERDYVTAARAVGMGDLRIIFRHILPNVIGPITVAATLGIAGAIIAEASLSYLGLGIQPPVPSWGNMIRDGQNSLRNAWWIVTFPGLMASLTTFSLYMLGDGLREALDPRLKK
jgi:peptide/nickel transport system permease protein